MAGEVRLTEQSSAAAASPGWDKQVEIFGKLKWEAFSVWMVFAVTIAVFPALTALIETGQSCSTFPTALFTPYLFVLFNVFDLIGRTTAGVIQVRVWV